MTSFEKRDGILYIFSDVFRRFFSAPWRIERDYLIPISFDFRICRSFTDSLLLIGFVEIHFGKELWLRSFGLHFWLRSFLLFLKPSSDSTMLLRLCPHCLIRYFI